MRITATDALPVDVAARLRGTGPSSALGRSESCNSSGPSLAVPQTVLPIVSATDKDHLEVCE